MTWNAVVVGLSLAFGEVLLCGQFRRFVARLRSLSTTTTPSPTPPRFLPVLARPFSLMLQHTGRKFYRSHLLRRVAWAWARGQLFGALDRRKASPLHDHPSATFLHLPRIEGGTNSKFQLTVLVCEVALLRYPPWY
jgi:hypothetical protein